MTHFRHQDAAIRGCWIRSSPHISKSAPTDQNHNFGSSKKLHFRVYQESVWFLCSPAGKDTIRITNSEGLPAKTSDPHSGQLHRPLGLITNQTEKRLENPRIEHTNEPVINWKKAKYKIEYKKNLNSLTLDVQAAIYHPYGYNQNKKRSIHSFNKHLSAMRSAVEAKAGSSASLGSRRRLARPTTVHRR